jgi:hypothetical protein
MLILLAAMLLLGMTLLRKIKRTEDLIAGSWLLFCQKMARIGLPRSPDQGPDHYARTIRELRPDLATPAAEIIGLYIALRYQKEPSPKAQVFQEAVRRFSPSAQKQ